MAANDAWQNKRKHPRISWGFMIKFKQDGSDSGWEGVSTVRDISEGGCSFNTSCEYRVDQVLELEIKFPSLRDPMPLRGEVKRSTRGTGPNLFFVGVQFLKMDEPKRNELTGILDFFIKKSERSKTS